MSARKASWDSAGLIEKSAAVSPSRLREPGWKGDDTADDATDAVYLVLMKGDFTLYNGGPGPVPSCAKTPTGRYFSAIFDATTFVTLEADLGNSPPPVPLRTLGPVLNLT